MAMRPEISVKDLLMQAFLTGWELSDKSISQDEYLQSAIQVIEVLQVEPENLYAEEGLGLPDGELSTLLDLSTARIAAMLNNLERKGAITRARDTADRRRVVVRLTEQGRNEVQTSFNEAVACLSEVYRRMGEADTRELLRLSDRAGEIAQQIYEEQKEDTPCGC